MFEQDIYGCASEVIAIRSARASFGLSAIIPDVSLRTYDTELSTQS